MVTVAGMSAIAPSGLWRFRGDIVQRLLTAAALRLGGMPPLIVATRLSSIYRANSASAPSIIGITTTPRSVTSNPRALSAARSTPTCAPSGI
jgi:hypothetical protein